MKFRLVTLLLLMTNCGLLAGWLTERKCYEHKIEEQVIQQTNIECSLSSAFHKNIFCKCLDSLARGDCSFEEFDDFCERSLVDNVVYLYLNLDNATRNPYEYGERCWNSWDQTGRMHDFAGTSLHLLGMESSMDLQKYFVDNPFMVELHGDELFTKRGRMRWEFEAFVSRAIETNREFRKKFEEIN